MSQVPGSPVDFLHQVQREERLADKVADLLKRAILSGQLTPGDRLPPERVLGERFGVSRTVVREAVRSLAAKGLVDVRSGSGSVIARVEADAVAETMQLYLQSAGVGADQVDEVRGMLVVHVAGMAAERATDVDVARLRDVLRAIAGAADGKERGAIDTKFHRAVALATHNPLYLVVLDAVGAPAAVPEGATPAGRAQEAALAYASLVDRIAAHDREGARTEMRLYLESRRAPERVTSFPGDGTLPPAGAS